MRLAPADAAARQSRFDRSMQAMSLMGVLHGTSARSALLSATPQTAAASWMPYWK